MRLAKLIAQRGVASRRQAEDLIRAGLVTVNGEVAVVTTPADPENDVVTVKGKKLPAEPKKVYYLLNKPGGYITARRDPQGRQDVMELVKHLPMRLEAVGRLDYDTEGALLFTNDGDTAHGLTHPSRGVPKVYVAKVEGHLMPEDMAAIARGVPLDDGVTAPAKARILGRARERNREVTHVEVTVTEGRNRLIRRIMAYLGHYVMELRRDRFGGVGLEGLAVGEVRELRQAEVEMLREQARPRKAVEKGNAKEEGAK